MVVYSEKRKANVPKILVVIDPDETQHSALNRIEETPIGQVQFKVVYYFSKTATQVSVDFRHQNQAKSPEQKNFYKSKC